MANCRAVISYPKVCQSCGESFSCGLSCCWCDEIAVDEGTRREIQARFTDCLCRACLEMAAREERAGSVPRPTS